MEYNKLVSVTGLGGLFELLSTKFLTDADNPVSAYDEN